VESINVPIPDYATKLSGAVSSALVKNPNIKAVFMVFDAQTTFVVSALKAKNTGVKTYAFGADEPAIELMADKSNPMGTDMGPSFPWMAYSGADQLFRAVAGEPVIPADKAFAPYRLFTPDNAGSATPPDYGFGNSYVAGYRSLWKDAPAS
jgi:ribose transport system substrate-binding protein